ncbi:MAG: hypothetical protein ABSC94_25065 [Polyangiaceae bacterium]|jgi:hypothetical protein
MTDLYRELRDRTALGDRLDAEARAPGTTEGVPAPGSKSARQANTSGGDPIAQCAFELLALVDDVGEVTLDVVHGVGSNGCLVSLGRSTKDGGAHQCLVREPEHPQRPGRKGGMGF